MLLMKMLKYDSIVTSPKLPANSPSIYSSVLPICKFIYESIAINIPKDN